MSHAVYHTVYSIRLYSDVICILNNKNNFFLYDS